MPVAETLGVVGSIIAIVQISKTIISLCHFYIDAVDGASSDLRVILIEVSTLKGIAKSLQYLTKPNLANSALVDQLVSVTGPIEGCKKALKELEKLFPPTALSVPGRKSKRRKIDAAVATLAWPLKSGKAKKLLQEIVQHKTTINLALTAEFVHDLKEVKQKVEDIENLLTASERQRIYQWLETTNPSGIHNRSQMLHEPGTTSWMLRTPEWLLWIEGKHRCLWIHGIPGAGKSILASYLAEEIEKHCNSLSTEASKFGYAYYYCYFGHNQDESTHFLCWIIGQLCRQSGRLPRQLHDLLEASRMPTLSSLLSILHTTVANFKRVYLILDAVDESMPRVDLLRIIRDLSTDPRFAAISLIVTSRQYVDIEQTMEACSVSLTMSNPFIEEDIGTFVRSTIQSEPRFQRWPEDLKYEMQDIIPKRAKGMFRWAVCQLDSLKRLKPDVIIIKAALSNLPRTLDETYERILLSIPEGYWLPLQHIFHWMVYHNELFRDNIALSTLLHAVEQSTESLLSHDAVQLYDLEGLRECCGCLIMVEEEATRESGSSSLEQQRNTVSFAHYTVKEYLLSPRISQKKVGHFSLAQERIRKEFAAIALRQALAMSLDGMDQYAECVDKRLIQHLINEDFRLYCGVSSVLQLMSWPDAISLDSALMDLIEELVNPFRTGYSSLCILLKKAEFGLDIPESFAFFREVQSWSTQWIEWPDPKHAVFLHFLLVSDGSATPYLAKAFASRHSMLPILKQPICIRKHNLFLFSEEDRDYYNIIGSIPEVVAQCAFSQQRNFDFVLRLISEHDEAQFDLSTLLLLSVRGHNHFQCDESCFVERLLSMGADPNGPERAFVTPLQIATSCWDLNGTNTLLNAGADVNATGADGSSWASGSLMERHNRLHGVAPLHIIQHLDCYYTQGIRNLFRRDEAIRRSIESRLMEVEAVDPGLLA